MFSSDVHLFGLVVARVFFWTLWPCLSCCVSDLFVCATLFSFPVDVVSFDVVYCEFSSLVFSSPSSPWSRFPHYALPLVSQFLRCKQLLIPHCFLLQNKAKQKKLHPSCVSDTLWRNLKVCRGKGVPSLLCSYIDVMLGINFHGITFTILVEFLEDVFFF